MYYHTELQHDLRGYKSCLSDVCTVAADCVTMKTSAVMNLYVSIVSESKMSSRMITKMFLLPQLVHESVCIHVCINWDISQNAPCCFSQNLKHMSLLFAIYIKEQPNP